MGIVRKITQETKHRFLNFFTMDVTHKNGKEAQYFLASRAQRLEDLKAVTHENHADGVVIYSVHSPGRDGAGNLQLPKNGKNVHICGDAKSDKVVLIRQYRYPIDGYVYEFPAGLVEPGEDFNEAAVREMKEETGLELEPISVSKIYSEPRFTTVGMTDESCATVYGYVSGECSIKGLEESEELEIVLADKKEVRRILKEERVALMCAYMMMHFLHAQEGEAFEFLEEE
ncbi:MAG: NUDIX hydrolase [Lachnospiraceae bacterium]|nr:NUDIX hydrolase [Lachnospiraceae bacterium]